MAISDVDIGKLRHRVRIQREKRTPDGGGGHRVTWDDVAEVWARVAPVSVSDNIKALAIALNVTHRVTMRWRNDLGEIGGERYRLIWGTAVLNITGISNNDEQRRFLTLVCESGQAIR